MDPKELIAALGVLANAGSSDEDKAAALEKLSAYFNSMLDSQEQETPAPEGTSETGGEAEEGEEPEKTSAALASALETIEALKTRVGTLEKASAVGGASRAARPTPLKRVEPKASPTIDPHAAVAIEMIEKAAQNTIGTLKRK